MNLIEQRAKFPPLPCLRCEDADACDVETRRTCPSMRPWRQFRREAYRRHLMWMARQMKWRGDGDE